MSLASRAALRGWAVSALGAVLLLWTALVNGRPAVFTDTALYYTQAEYLFEALHLVSPAQAVEPPDDPTALPAVPGAANISASIDRARSPLYGALVYGLQRTGGLWLVAAAQAWAVAAMIYLLFRAAAPGAPQWGYLALMAGLAALTPLPFFASWIMPDVFAGVAACGLLLLLVYPDRLGRGALASAAVLTGYGLAVHRSNLLDAAAVAVCGAALLRLAGAPTRTIGRRLAMLGAVVAFVLAATALVYLPIRARAGEPIGTPPFLSARVLADGPGRDYLRSVCTPMKTPFALCAFRDRPMASSDQILWSNRRRKAVFLAADPATRLQMERQDARFAEGAALFEPGREAQAAAWNAAQQLAMVNVDEPLKAQSFYVTDPYWRQTVLPRILPGAHACALPHSCQPLTAVWGSWGAEGLGLGMAALFLAWRLSAQDVLAMLGRGAQAGWRDDRVRLLTTLGLILSLLVANAVACGALSGPFARYQARLIWLAPLVAGLVAAQLGPRRRQHRESQSNQGVITHAASLDGLAAPL